MRDALTAPLRRAGYGYVEPPAFEDTALFSRGVGESTDVVSKEMYTFTDRGDRSITLRPELTAGLMRAFIEHRLHSGPAGEALGGRLGLPLRAAAGRPLPALHPGRLRGARRGGPGAGRRAADRRGAASAVSGSPDTRCC